MKKMIDQNGRLFGLISLIDVVVILMVCLLGFAFITKQNNLTPSGENVFAGTTVTYQLRADSIVDELVPNIYVGDSLYDHDQVTGGSIGTITAIEVSPASRRATLPDGTVIDAPEEGYSDVLITVEGTCDIVEGSYRFNNVYILGVNAARNFHTPFARFKAVVTSIA